MNLVIDKLALLYLRDRRVLCARSRGNPVWYLPGGKREPGESDEAALGREIREELAVELVPGSLVYAGEFSAQADGRAPGTIVRSRCYFATLDGEPAPAAEIEELAWMAHRDGARCSVMARMVLDYLSGAGLID